MCAGSKMKIKLSFKKLVLAANSAQTPTATGPAPPRTAPSTQLGNSLGPHSVLTSRQDEEDTHARSSGRLAACGRPRASAAGPGSQMSLCVREPCARDLLGKRAIEARRHMPYVVPTRGGDPSRPRTGRRRRALALRSRWEVFAFTSGACTGRGKTDPNATPRTAVTVCVSGSQSHGARGWRSTSRRWVCRIIASVRADTWRASSIPGHAQQNCRTPSCSTKLNKVRKHGFKRIIYDITPRLVRKVKLFLVCFQNLLGVLLIYQPVPPHRLVRNTPN